MMVQSTPRLLIAVLMDIHHWNGWQTCIYLVDMLRLVKICEEQK